MVIRDVLIPWHVIGWDRFGWFGLRFNAMRRFCYVLGCGAIPWGWMDIVLIGLDWMAMQYDAFTMLCNAMPWDGMLLYGLCWDGTIFVLVVSDGDGF